MEKSTIETSRKIYAMKISLAFIALITVAYIIGSHFTASLDASVTVTAIGAIGTIVSTLNIADGMKKGE